MTSSFTQSERPIDRASRAMRIASSAVRQPAVLGRMRYRFQSITSRMVFFFGSSRSRRRSATVTSSHPDASSAASIDSSVAYLPVPMKSRERSSTPATTSGSACVIVCTGSAYRAPPALRATSPKMGRTGRASLGQILLQEQRLVTTVGQALDCIFDRQPHQLVDLDPRFEPSAARLHHPVAGDLVSTAPVDVRCAAERADQLASQPGLLPDLAQGAVLGALVRLDLALGQGPVVVGGAMNDGDL